MIPITANVSNALVRYGQKFGRKPLIGEIPTSYTDPEAFVKDIDEAISNNDPIFGEGNDKYLPTPKRRGRKKRPPD